MGYASWRMSVDSDRLQDLRGACKIVHEQETLSEEDRIFFLGAASAFDSLLSFDLPTKENVLIAVKRSAANILQGDV